MDIEKLIELLSRYSEPVIAYKLDADFAAACMEAANELAKIPSFQAENEKLRAELEQVKAERDAAISDLETIMAYGGGNLDTCQYCKNGQCYARGGTKPCLPKWRGKKEEEA